MGNLVDKFIVRIKPEFASATLPIVLERIPPRYHPMMSAIWEKLGDLEDILSNDNDEVAYTAAEPFNDEANDVRFDHRYRKSCLKQIIRTEFFDTLLIIENDFNWEKTNWYVVLKPKQVIAITIEGETESEERPEVPDDVREKTLFLGHAEDIVSENTWAEKASEDETFVRGFSDVLKKRGYDVKPGWE